MTFPGAATLNDHAPPLTAHTGGCTLLTKDLESKTYILNEKGALGYRVSDNSERERLLNQIESIHTTFFKKVEEYETERMLHPGSEHSQRLYKECKNLAAASEKLIDQL